MSVELSVRGLRSGYGAVEVLHGIDLDLPAHGVTALLGRNGAGKSSLLATLAGLLPVRAGQVMWSGRDITGWSTRERASAGMLLVPERRGIFAQLTVAEHLQLFARGPAEWLRVEETLVALPALAARLEQPAWSLSGGEQQMLAMARPLVQRPPLLLLDEVSFGLAPQVAELLLGLVAELARTSTVLLVEQYVQEALNLADIVYVLERGELVFAGEPSQLAAEIPSYGR